jgi:hypothetical protein
VTAPQSTGTLTTYDQHGVPEAGVEIHLRVVSAGGTMGLALDSSVRTVLSDEEGEVEVPNLFVSVHYRIWRGDDARGALRFVVPAGETFALPSAVGKP